MRLLRTTIQIAAALVGSACLASCDTVGARFVDASGRHGDGDIRGDVYNWRDGSLTIYDRSLSCSGRFPDWAAYTITFAVECSDGRKGMATMTRPTNYGAMAGEGIMQFTDGTSKRFIFGPKKTL